MPSLNIDCPTAPRKPVSELSDDELFDELREQVMLAKNTVGGHDRPRTRAVAGEARNRGCRMGGK